MTRILVRPIEAIPTCANSGHSKAVDILYKIIEVWSCLDFGFFEHESAEYRIVWKCFTVFRAVSFVSAFLILKKSHTMLSTISVYSELSFYFLNVMILICLNSNRSFCNLLSDLKLIDKRMRIRFNCYDFEKKVIFWNIFFIVLNIAECYFLCFQEVDICISSPLPLFIYFTAITSMNLLYVSCSFYFYSINYRLKYLTSILKTENFNIIDMQHIYRDIVVLAENYKAVLDPIVR